MVDESRRVAEGGIGADFFVGYPYNPRWFGRGNFKMQVRKACEGLECNPYFYDDDFEGDILTSKIFDKIYSTAFGVYDLTDGNGNVLIEVGYAFGRGKQVIILKQRGSDFQLPSDIQAFERIEYDDLIDMERQLRIALSSIRAKMRARGTA